MTPTLLLATNNPHKVESDSALLKTKDQSIVARNHRSFRSNHFNKRDKNTNFIYKKKYFISIMFLIATLIFLGYQKTRIDDIILRQFNRIHNPQLDVTEFDFGDMVVEKTYPGTITYLYDREPFTIFAQVQGEIGGRITIRGKVDEEDYTMNIDLDQLEIEEKLLIKTK